SVIVPSVTRRKRRGGPMLGADSGALPEEGRRKFGGAAVFSGKPQVAAPALSGPRQGSVAASLGRGRAASAPGDQRRSLRMTSFSPDQTASTAATLTSTRSSSSASAR